MPTLRHLQIFVAVATYNKMGDAAKSLYLSQSTVSQAIAEMEKHYNVLLFERLSKRLLITESGRILFEDAKKVLADYERLEDHMRDISQSYTLRIGVSGSAAAYYAEPIIDAMQEKFPSLHIEVYSHSSAYIRSCLKDNALDVGVLTSLSTDPELAAIPAFVDQLQFACGQGHPFYDRDTISVQELRGQTFLLREPSNGGRQMLERFLEENQIPLTGSWTSGSVETMKLWLENNRGIALMSEAQIRSECAMGLLKILHVEGVNLNRKLYAVYHRDKYQNKPLKFFLSACSQTL